MQSQTHTHTHTHTQTEKHTLTDAAVDERERGFSHLYGND